MKLSFNLTAIKPSILTDIPILQLSQDIPTVSFWAILVQVLALLRAVYTANLYLQLYEANAYPKLKQSLSKVHRNPIPHLLTYDH